MTRKSIVNIIKNSTIGAVSLGQGGKAVGRVDANTSDAQASTQRKIKAAQSNNAKLERLRRKGQVPILEVKPRTREWGNRVQCVFRMEIENIGRVMLTEFGCSLEGFVAKQSLRLNEKTSRAIAFHLSGDEAPVSQELLFRYVTEFGHKLEQRYDLSFNPKTAHHSDLGLTIIGQNPMLIQE